MIDARKIIIGMGGVLITAILLAYAFQYSVDPGFRFGARR